MNTGRGGVEFEDILLGEGALAAPGCVAHVRYDLFLNQGERVQEDEAAAFRIGERRVIPGLEYGVEGMRVGGRRRLRVGPHLGYREAGVPGMVPPDAVLEFDLVLVGIVPGRLAGD